MSTLQLTAERDRLQARRQVLLERLWERRQRLAAMPGRAELPVEAIQALLRQQQAGLLTYARLPNGRFTALALRPDGSCQEVSLGEVTDAELGELLIERPTGPTERTAPRHVFQSPVRLSRTERAFEQLYGELWAPLERAGALAELEHLYLVPDGWLRVLPFGALYQVGPEREPRYLIEQPSTLSVLLSSGLLPQLEAARQRARAQPRTGFSLILNPGDDPALAEIATALG